MAFAVDQEKGSGNQESQCKESKVMNFEDAIQLIGFGKFHYFLICISGLFMGSAFYETMSINYILPISECDLEITSKKQYGIVSGVWFAGIILTSHSWGFLSDTYGRRKILIVASLSAFVTSMLSSLSMNFGQMVLFRFLNGCFIAGSTGTIFAYLGEFLDANSRSRSIMVSSFIFGVSCLVLPFMALLTLNRDWSFEVPVIDIVFKPWRLFILLCSLPSLICGSTLIFFPESPKFIYNCKKNAAETVRILKRIQICNTGKFQPEFQLPPIENIEESPKKNVFKMMKDQMVELVCKYPRSLTIMSALQFGTYFVCNGMLVFFPDILNQISYSGRDDVLICEIVENTIAERTELLEKESMVCVEKFDISVYYFVIYLEVCYVLGFAAISGLLWMKTSRLLILNFVFITCGVCGILITFIENLSASSYLYVWLLACGLNNSLLNTVTYELFPTHLRSLAMSLSLMTGRLGGLVGGNVAGFLLEQYCGETFLISGILILLCAGATFLIPNILSKKQQNYESH